MDTDAELSEKLCQIGDSIVYKLVQWTKRLPFYAELPVEVHTRLLTLKWHELLVLTTSAYQAIHGAPGGGGGGGGSSGNGNGSGGPGSSSASQSQPQDFAQQVSANLVTLQTCLAAMMGQPLTLDQLRQDVGLMVERITHVTMMLQRCHLRMEEYVCLKVIAMLSQGPFHSSLEDTRLFRGSMKPASSTRILLLT